MASHEILGGLVQVYKRGGKHWHCSATVAGKQRRTTTKEEGLSEAKQFAEDWFLELRGKARAGLFIEEKTFAQAADKQLYTATRQYAHDLKGKTFQWNAEQVHDYVLFMANTGLRPDEAMARNLEHRDVTIADDRATGERILEIKVRGKRGVGYCKSMPSAVRPYERLRDRETPESVTARKTAKREGIKLESRYPQPTDPVFPGNHIKLFNGVLTRAGLKLDRDGKKRTAYSLRHTYICMRLTEGADIYQIAKNCRTSVEMIQKFYATHIKDLLDTTAINVMRPKAARQPIVLPKNSEGGESATRAASPARKRRRQEHGEEGDQR